MANLIHLLPDSVVNQIAAGEVIQRPASVVKELMDNAIDSGATEIHLKIQEAGKDFILIQDNGCGMSPIDARMSFERHATSKIKTSEDLFKIQTLGFRGEALASIASVSRVDLKTKRHEDEAGTKIIIQDSKVIKQEACACPNGTQIQVSDLFYSVPARKKFLKSNAVELKHIRDEFIAQALSHPEIGMSFTQDQNLIFKCPPEGLRQRISNLFGKKIIEHLIEVQQETEVVNISGFVGDIEFLKKSRGEQFLFINRRLIKNYYLNHAITTAYEEVLAQQGYPFYVLFLNINPERIDINVHPTKHEIKFDDERLIYNFLKVSIKQSLGKQIIAPTLDFDNATPGISEIFSTTKFHDQSSKLKYTNTENKFSSQKVEWKQLAFPTTSRDHINIREEKIFTPQESESEALNHLFSKEYFGENKISQIYNSYILYVTKAGIHFIDQQNAHERILYEFYLNQQNQESVVSEKLLFPQTIHLTKSDAEILLNLIDELKKLGIEVEHFGSESFIIVAMPELMQGKFIEKELITSMIDQYKMNLDLNLQLRENVARSMSLSSAIKRGKILTEEEMIQITEQLFLCENPNVSPSGKKCIYSIPYSEFVKKFNQ